MLMLDGDHVPVMLLLDVFAKLGAVSVLHNVGIAAKVGKI
jgi:hypothetical protein